MSEDIFLGKLLGRREAFAAIAGRCSAADAGLLRDIRKQKLYLQLAPDWGQFCKEHLHISRENADRLIRLLDEFGPEYFAVTQLTRISPKAYRTIAESIREQAVHYNGEAIALIPENAERVAAAVADLRKAAEPPLLPAPEPAPAPAAPQDPLPALEKDCYDVLHRIEAVITLRLPHRYQLLSIVGAVRDHLNRLEQMV